LCASGLEEISDLHCAQDALNAAQQKTLEHLLTKKQQISAKLQQANQEKDEIISQYAEGIAALKRYELHPKLSKDQKKQQYLIDIYYSETSMNNFKVSVMTQVDKLN